MTVPASLEERLCQAILRKDAATIAALLEQGVDIDAVHGNVVGDNALRLACRMGDTDTFNLLLKAGADPALADMYGHSVIYDVMAQLDAPDSAWKPVFLSLLDRGLPVVQCDDMGRTPFEIMASRALYDLADAILAHGGNVNARNEHGQTPLMAIACKPGTFKYRLEATEYLIDRGADEMAENLKGDTVFAIARLRGLDDVIACIEEAVQRRSEKIGKMLHLQKKTPIRRFTRR